MVICIGYSWQYKKGHLGLLKTKQQMYKLQN